MIIKCLTLAFWPQSVRCVCVSANMCACQQHKVQQERVSIVLRLHQGQSNNCFAMWRWWRGRRRSSCCAVVVQQKMILINGFFLCLPFRRRSYYNTPSAAAAPPPPPPSSSDLQVSMNCGNNWWGALDWSFCALRVSEERLKLIFCSWLGMEWITDHGGE